MSGTTPYTPSGTYPDFDGSGAGPLELQDDGQVLQWLLTFRNDSDAKKGTLAKLIDGIDYLEKHAGFAKVAAYVGNAFTIVAGPLSDFMEDVADHAARRDAANAFTSTQDFQQAVTVEKALYLAAGSSISRPVAGAGIIATSATTATTDAALTHNEFIAEAWAGAGGVLAFTLAAYTGGATIANPEVTVVFNPTKPSARCYFVEAGGGGNTFVVLIGPGAATFRWSGTAWHLRPGSCGASVEIVNG